MSCHLGRSYSTVDVVGRNVWIMVEHIVKKAAVDLDRRLTVRTQRSLNRFLQSLISTINDLTCNRNTSDWKDHWQSNQRTNSKLTTSIAPTSLYLCPPIRVVPELRISKIGVESLLAMNPVLNWIPMTSEYEYGDVQDSTGILTWPLPTTQPDKHKLWSNDLGCYLVW